MLFKFRHLSFLLVFESLDEKTPGRKLINHIFLVLWNYKSVNYETEGNVGQPENPLFFFFCVCVLLFELTELFYFYSVYFFTLACPEIDIPHKEMQAGGNTDADLQRTSGLMSN